jgi:glycosyltransferase involved in cell wall biosynthesis
MPIWVVAFYHWADAVVAVSQGVADDLRRITGLGEDKVRVIYNPVITPAVFNNAEEPLEHAWFAQGEPPVVLGVGRLTAQKDFATLIRAFRQVRNHCEARLVILGEGQERSRLEAMLKELGLSGDASLPGFVDNPYPYMKHAAVFVLSSRWEGFGIVVAEALALGSPVVATNCPSGPAEILGGGRWGQLVPVGATTEMARAVVTILSGQCEIDGQERASDFTIERVIPQYAEVFGL